jgi:hypothetical protein
MLREVLLETPDIFISVFKKLHDLGKATIKGTGCKIADTKNPFSIGQGINADLNGI